MCGVPILFWTFEHIFICGVPTLFRTFEHIYMCSVPIIVWTSEQNFMCSVPTLIWKSVRCSPWYWIVCRFPTGCYVWCPNPGINIWTHFHVRYPPWFWMVSSVHTCFFVLSSGPHINLRTISCVSTSFLIFEMIPLSGMSVQLLSSSVALPAKLVGVIWSDIQTG